MNLSILILPALLATLAASAVHPLPADLKHDVAGKAPLTVARMAVARGAGSTCRLGCNEPDDPCHPIIAFGDVIGYQQQIWNKHKECAYATGSDACKKLKDVICNTVYSYGTDDSGCYGSGSPSRTTSSTCVIEDIDHEPY